MSMRALLFFVVVMLALAPQAQAQPLAPAQATNLEVRFSQLEQLLRQMSGQLEQSQNQTMRLQQQLERMNADYDTRFRMLETRLNNAEQAAAHNAASGAAAASNNGIALDPTANPEQAATDSEPQGEDDAAGETAKDTAKEGAKNQPKASAAELYDGALNALRRTDYETAQQGFEQFLKHYPRDALAENAQYWLAETYYVRKQYEAAAQAFATGFQQYPEGSKAPDNLLKLGMSLGALNKKPDACTTLAELRRKFPQAPAIVRTRAEQERRRLACK